MNKTTLADLAEMITRDNLAWVCKRTPLDPWTPSNSKELLESVVQANYPNTLKIATGALSPFGLPWGRIPSNPDGIKPYIITRDFHRAIALGEHTPDFAEWFEPTSRKWVKRYRGQSDSGTFTYRVPLTLPCIVESLEDIMGEDFPSLVGPHDPDYFKEIISREVDDVESAPVQALRALNRQVEHLKSVILSVNGLTPQVRNLLTLKIYHYTGEGKR